MTNEAAFKGVIWPGRRVKLPDGRIGYLTTVVGAFVTDEPTPFDGETNDGLTEVVLVGTSSTLVPALAEIARGHTTFKLGDASMVLTSLDSLKPGPS